MQHLLKPPFKHPIDPRKPTLSLKLPAVQRLTVDDDLGFKLA